MAEQLTRQGKIVPLRSTGRANARLLLRRYIYRGNMDTSVIENVLTSTVFMGIAAFVARSLFTHYLNKDISNFKQQLQNDASKQVESYKSELEKDRLRLQISYGGIFEKQANAILELYQYLLKLDQARYLAVHDSKLPTDRRKEFMLHWREIRHKYSELRVLLPEHIDQDLEDFFSQMFKNILNYNSLDQRLTSNVSDEEYEKIEEAQEEVFQFLEQKISALQESLISEMRKTLGVHIEK